MNTITSTPVTIMPRGMSTITPSPRPARRRYRVILFHPRRADLARSAAVSARLAATKSRRQSAAGERPHSRRRGADRPAVIQGAQHLLHTLSWLDRWPDADRRSKIVFITQNFDRAEVEDMIAVLDRVAARTAAARARARASDDRRCSGDRRSNISIFATDPKSLIRLCLSMILSENRYPLFGIML